MLLDNYPHTITHNRPAHTQGTYGGDRTTDTAQATDVECWIQNATEAEITEFAKRDIRVTHKMYMAPDDASGILPGDQFVVTAGPSFVGQTLNYRSHSDKTAGLGLAARVMCEVER